jgi:hypothetical protein
MTSKQTKLGDGQNAGDSGNKGFVVREHVVHHKPGFDHGGPERELETEGNHAFRRSEQKDIPQGTLADRISKSRKGDSYVKRPI